MHELGLCASIVDAVEQRAGDRPVARVRIRVGRLHHVHPEAFDQSFAVAAMGSVAEDAAAELVLLPVSVRCSSCGAATEGVTSCRRPARSARGVDLEIVGGDELILESIEYRAPLAVDGVGDAMCLGIPGQVVELLGRARAPGARRRQRRRADRSTSGCSRTRACSCGDWVLIHVGFAMSKIDEEEARLALGLAPDARRGLRRRGRGPVRHRRPSEPAAGSAGRHEVRRRVPGPGGGPPARRPHHRAGRRRPLQVHGGVRRPHPHHLPPRHRARPARPASSWSTAPAARCASSRWAGSTTPSRWPRRRA